MLAHQLVGRSKEPSPCGHDVSASRAICRDLSRQLEGDQPGSGKSWSGTIPRPTPRQNCRGEEVDTIKGWGGGSAKRRHGVVPNPG